jgi:capsular polysaccharide export protein
LRILLLQGPVGGFFGYLARHLELLGHRALKIDFNGGDFFFSSTGPRLAYREGHRKWRAWLRAHCAETKPDVILVLGDQRPIHRVAARVAREAGIRFFCFEEGYLRPNYVTFEEGGNNAVSPARRTWPTGLPEPDAESPPKHNPSFKHMGWKASAYYTAMAFARPFFKGYLHHRRRGWWSEVYYWNRSYLRLLVSRKADAEATEWLRGPDHPSFFLIALQVHDDLQLLRHGKGWRNTNFVRAIMDSFAVEADPRCRLVFKVHPQDRGHRSYRRRIQKEAVARGLEKRVLVLQSGALMPVIRNARGLITINSTSGMAALEAGIPVYAFGEAIYRHNDLVGPSHTIEGLASFWKDPKPPDADKVKSFINHLRLHSLLPGSFYDEDTWHMLADSVAKRLEAEI